ncbi:MAG: lipoprotein [Rhodoferax sp.]
MLIFAKQILVSALVLGACTSTLVGCGQTGSLYLPAKPTAPAPSKSAANAPQALNSDRYSFYS